MLERWPPGNMKTYPGINTNKVSVEHVWEKTHSCCHHRVMIAPNQLLHCVLSVQPLTVQLSKQCKPFLYKERLVPQRLRYSLKQRPKANHFAGNQLELQTRSKQATNNHEVGMANS